MTLLAAALTPYSANRFGFIFSIVAMAAVAIYFAYGAVDRMGLAIEDVDATVLNKLHNPSGTAYNTVIAGGRSWVQSHATSETYVAVLRVAGEETAGLVSKELFDSLNAGDPVRAKVRRTRITRRLEAVEISRN